MGNACSNKNMIRNRKAPIKANTTRTRECPMVSGTGTIYMIVCSLDYKQTSNPLTCTIDGNNMIELAQSCGARIEKLYDEQATVPNVKQLLAQVGSQVGPDDYFIFYYSGHGTNLPDQDGDEEDEQDEAFCFVDEAGQVSFDTCLRDDDFVDIVTSSVHEEARIILISDCCHSGTVADLSKPEWEGFHAVSISGCTDTQTSGDTGRGGICTHSMLLAISKLQQAGEDDYSLAVLYNATLKEDDRVFDSAQDITLQASPGFNPDDLSWPLVPSSQYMAPMSKAKQNTGGADLGQMPAEQLAAMGIPPAMAAFANGVPDMDEDELQDFISDAFGAQQGQCAQQ